MSFEEHIPHNLSARSRDEVFSASLQKMASAPAKLHITVTAPMLVRLRWRYDDRFKAMVGTGEDHGRIRITPHPERPLRLRRRNAGASEVDFGDINFGVVPAFVDEKRKTENCQMLRLPNGVIELILPAWAWDSKRGPKPAHLRAVS